MLCDYFAAVFNWLQKVDVIKKQLKMKFISSPVFRPIENMLTVLKSQIWKCTYLFQP